VYTGSSTKYKPCSMSISQQEIRKRMTSNASRCPIRSKRCYRRQVGFTRITCCKVLLNRRAGSLRSDTALCTCTLSLCDVMSCQHLHRGQRQLQLPNCVRASCCCSSNLLDTEVTQDGSICQQSSTVAPQQLRCWQFLQDLTMPADAAVLLLLCHSSTLHQGSCRTPLGEVRALSNQHTML
jgi:hypothetical protein